MFCGPKFGMMRAASAGSPLGVFSASGLSGNIANPGSTFYGTDGQMTWQFWFKRVGTGNIISLINRLYDDNFKDSWTVYKFYFNTAHTSAFATTASASGLLELLHWTNIPTDGNWHNFAWRYSGGTGNTNTRHSLYIDGVSHDANRVVDTNRSSAMGPIIGSSLDAMTLFYDTGNQGRCDMFYMFDEVSSGADIATRMNIEVAPGEANLKRRYLLEENLTDTQTNVTPVNFPGTPTYYEDVPLV